MADKFTDTTIIAAGTSTKITWLLDLSSSTDHYNRDMKELERDLAILIIARRLHNLNAAISNGTDRIIANTSNGTDRKIADKDSVIQSSDTEPVMTRSASINELTDKPMRHQESLEQRPTALTTATY